jgi:ribosomal-protein-alanine N-acetyltransferase
MNELRTERLLLRRWREDDREPFADLCADPVVMEHYPSVLTREQAEAMADRVDAHFAEHGYGLWAVDVDGRFAGYTGLVWTDALGGHHLEVGWRLAHWAWGNGYASEAAEAAVALGLGHTDEVVSFTAVDNVRSQRVMQRIGMRPDGEFDHPRIPDGHRLKRHVLYRIP